MSARVYLFSEVTPLTSEMVAAGFRNVSRDSLGTIGGGAAAADAQSAELAAMPEGDRTKTWTRSDDTGVIGPIWLHDGTGTNATLSDLLVNGPDDTNLTTYISDYFNQVVTNGDDIDNLFLDIEVWNLEPTGNGVFKHHSGPSEGLGLTSQERIDKMQAVWDTPAALAKIPKWFQDIAVIDDFGQSGAGTETVRRWAQWARWREMEHYRKVFKNASEAILGHPVRCLNFRDQIESYPTYPKDSWERGTYSAGGIASHRCYLEDTVNNFRYSGITKEPRWNNFIDAINAIKSSLAAGAPTIPWFGTPNFNGVEYTEPPFLWIEFVKHLWALGINDFLFFNNPAQPTHDAMVALAASTFVSIQSIERQQVDLSETALDVDSVTTGPVTTVYDASLVT